MDTAKYTLMTDTSCDLTEEFYRSIDVEVIALEFTINGVTKLDSQSDAEQRGVGPIHDFYSALRDGGHATTSQVTIQRYIDMMGSFLEKGDLLYLAFSSGLSGSYHSACAAAMELREKYPHRTLYVIDTKAASLGEGLLVSHAARKRLDGVDIHTLKKWVEDNWTQYCHLVTVDNLHHLRAGGRISATTEFIGSIFDIKPMIRVDMEGHLIADGKVRGRKRALRRLVEQVSEDIIDPASQVMYMCQGDCIDEAELLRDMLIKDVGVADVKIGYAGPVIGSHTGPGVIAVFYLGRNRH